MADQVHRMGGTTQHVTVATTTIMQPDGGGWKVALIHAVDLR